MIKFPVKLTLKKLADLNATIPGDFLKNKMPALASREGISLVEVLISTVIFSIAALGLFSTLSIMRTSSNVSDLRLGAAYYGKQCLEQLRAKVDQRAVDPNTGDFTNELSVGDHCCSGGAPPCSPDPVYTGVYTVSIDPDTQARKVALSVTWDE